MNIDIERLATDAAYWDEVAPEGATHYAPPVPGYIEGWLKGDEEYADFMPVKSDQWLPGSCVENYCIPRPQAPEAEWPEPGSKWEHHSGRVYVVVDITNGKTERPDQYPVTVVYQNVSNGTLWSRPLNDWSRSFTPIRTPEPRQRDELVDLISYHPIYKDAVAGLADAILSRYNLEPKE